MAPSSSSIILTPSMLRSFSSLWLAREMQPFRAREEVTTHVAAGRRRGWGLILCKTYIHTLVYGLYLTSVNISESDKLFRTLGL